MAAGDILTKLGTIEDPTITLASLADAAGRASAEIDNSTDQFPAALVNARIEMGTSPDAGGIVDLYLLRKNANGESDDGWSGSDSAFTPANAPKLGSLRASGSTGEVLEATFDTQFLGALGDSYGIGVFNRSGAALDSTESNHEIEITPYRPSVEQ